MNLEVYKELFTDTNNWLAIWPSLTLAIMALALLVLELLLPPKKHIWIPRVAISTMAVVFILPFFAEPLQVKGAGELFAGMLWQDGVSNALRPFFLLCAIGVSYLGLVYLKKQELPKIEFFHLVTLVTAAMLLLVQSHNFVMLFVSLEAVTVGFYVLVGYCRTSEFSLEAGLKYLILGGVSSAILLFGIVLLYGAAGNPALEGSTSDAMNFSALAAFLEVNSTNPVALVGAALVIAGIAFKIGAVPFQIWVPDVYQGAPTPVTAFLAIASKAAGFVVLLKVCLFALYPLADSLLIPMLSAMAVVTILFGNLAATGQQNVKRLMGLSGIAHAGYLLVGVVACLSSFGTELFVDAQGGVWFYLLTYLLGSFAVFGVMAHIAGADDANQSLDDYRELSKRSPFMAGVLAIGLGSLAGIPPLAGFMGKLLLLLAAWRIGLTTLVIVSIIGVVISIAYYFGWMRAVYLTSDETKPEAKPIKLLKTDALTLGAFATLTFVLGVYQGGIGNWLFGS